MADTEYIARRAPGCARDAGQQLRIAAITDNEVVQVWYMEAHIRNARGMLRPEDVQKTLIGLTPEDLRQVHRAAVPRHTTDRAELVYELAGAILLGPGCDTHAFIEGSRLGTATTTQGACSGTLFSLE